MDPALKRRADEGILQYAWTFYYAMHRQKQEYRCVPYKEIKTASDFWAVHTTVHKCSRLDNADYFIFKNPCKPKWEDEYCKSGALWEGSSH